mgnify:FL=1
MTLTLTLSLPPNPNPSPSPNPDPVQVLSFLGVSACLTALGQHVENVAGFQMLFDGSLQRDLLGKLKVPEHHGVDVPGAPVTPVVLPQDRDTALLQNMRLQLEVVHLYNCVPAKQRALATNLEHVFAACIEVLPESGLSGLQTVFLKEIVPVVRGTLASL